MTKQVRIENADSNPVYKLTVEVWQKGNENTPDSLVSTNILNYPADLFTGYVHSNQYIVVKELN